MTDLYFSLVISPITLTIAILACAIIPIAIHLYCGIKDVFWRKY